MRAVDEPATPWIDGETERAWDRLAAATPQPDPFCATTHWQLAFREALDPHRPLIVRRCEDGLIQFTEHDVPDGKAVGPIELNWMFGCNLLGPSAIDLLSGLFAEFAGDEHMAAISGLDPAGGLLSALKRRIAGSHDLKCFRKEVQCAAALDGGVDGFLSRRSGNFRRNLRRYAKRAADNGVTFERHSPSSDDEADAVFARMLAVELTSWKGLQRCGMESPRMTRFYTNMLRRLARIRAARVIFAMQEGRDIGFIFGGLAGDIYRGQQFSFDERMTALSVGNLMQFETGAMALRGRRRPIRSGAAARAVDGVQAVVD